jgi:glutamyl-tRNA reductase
VAKEVRSTTAIGANIVSMAAATVHLAERIFENLRTEGAVHRRRRDDRAVRRALRRAAAEMVTVANRTLERGRRWRRASAATPCASTRSASAWPSTTS